MSSDGCKFMLPYKIVLLPIDEEVTQCPLPLWCMWIVSWLLYSNNSLILFHDWLGDNGLFYNTNFIASSKSPSFKRQWSWVSQSPICSNFLNLICWQDATSLRKYSCNKIYVSSYFLIEILLLTSLWSSPFHFCGSGRVSL